MLHTYHLRLFPELFRHLKQNQLFLKVSFIPFYETSLLLGYVYVWVLEASQIIQIFSQDWETFINFQDIIDHFLCEVNFIVSLSCKIGVLYHVYHVNILYPNCSKHDFEEFALLVIIYYIHSFLRNCLYYLHMSYWLY